MSLAKSIQNTIRHKIKALDTTAYDLEKKAGLTKGSIYKFMTGHINNPSLETLERIAEALQYETIADLFMDTDTPSKRKTNKVVKHIEWDEDLFTKTIKHTLHKIKDLHSARGLKNKKIDTERLLFIIKEIYEYTILKDPKGKEFDMVFSNWFIENNIPAIFI